MRNKIDKRNKSILTMKKSIIINSLSIFCAMTATSAIAAQLPTDPTAKLKVGLNAGLANYGYHSDNAVSVLPHAFYDNNDWYIEGSEAGYYPYKDNKNHLRVGVSYDGRSFDPESAKITDLTTLDERQSSVLAHASYMHITPIGGFRAKVAIDALARYEGVSASLAHLSKFNFLDDKLTVYPSVGVAWHSKQYNQYYFGISQDEQAKTKLNAYTPKSSVSPYASITGEYAINDSWSVFGNSKIEKLASTQQQSPLVDTKMTTTVRIGASYEFK